ncbi:MAG: secretin N-terminal domain-containing protein [Candidatus Omnitrophota bacterium]
MAIKMKIMCNLESVKCKVIFWILLYFLLQITHYTLRDSFAQEKTGGPPQIEGDVVITENPAQEPQPEQQQEALPQEQSPEAIQNEEGFQEPSREMSEAPDLSEEESQNGVKVEAERISLDLKGIDINELLRILSLKMDLSIVPSKNVSGRVNIFLNNLTFEDALDVILISQELASERSGDIVNIMTAAEYEKLYGEKYNEKRKFKTIKLRYAKPATVFTALSDIKSDIGKVTADEASGIILIIDTPEKIELMEKTAKELDQPLATEVFDLQYAKPADMKTLLATAITSGPGELFVDERNGKVMVSDLPEKMKKIKRIVKVFDESSRQVFIEAEILQITLKDEYQRGVNWEKIIPERTHGNVDLVGTFPVSPSFTPSPLLTVDNLKMVLGSLSTQKYTMTLQWLQSLGDIKILSRPRIAAVNNQEAKILIGSREAYVSQTLSQAETTTVTSESIEFIDVGVKLNVVPTINEEGFVTMKIKPEVSTVRETITTALGSRIPIVETSEAETVVKVKDGTMIMIAGLMKEEKRKDVSGIPFLSKIPFIGAAFGTRDDQKKNTEIIIFLTPYIISGARTVPGTAMEKIFPADFVPEDKEGSIIFDRIKDIKVKTKEVPFEEQIKQPDLSLADRKQLVDIKKKFKGLKSF